MQYTKIFLEGHLESPEDREEKDGPPPVSRRVYRRTVALIRLRCSHLRLHIVRFFLFLLLLLFYVRQGEEAGSRDQAGLQGLV